VRAGEQAIQFSAAQFRRPAVPPLQVKYILGLTIGRADKVQDYLELLIDNLWQFK
jgi:hypothetical protein